MITSRNNQWLQVRFLKSVITAVEAVECVVHRARNPVNDPASVAARMVGCPGSTLVLRLLVL